MSSALIIINHLVAKTKRKWKNRNGKRSALASWRNGVAYSKSKIQEWLEPIVLSMRSINSIFRSENELIKKIEMEKKYKCLTSTSFSLCNCLFCRMVAVDNCCCCCLMLELVLNTKNVLVTHERTHTRIRSLALSLESSAQCVENHTKCSFPTHSNRN